MNETIIITSISLITSISSIVFAFLAFKRNEKQDYKKEGKNEGLILSDIGYIKACVDRMEKNITSVDERYRSVLERLSKTEESLEHTISRVNEIVRAGGG